MTKTSHVPSVPDSVLYDQTGDRTLNESIATPCGQDCRLFPSTLFHALRVSNEPQMRLCVRRLPGSWTFLDVIEKGDFYLDEQSSELVTA